MTHGASADWGHMGMELLILGTAGLSGATWLFPALAVPLRTWIMPPPAVGGKPRAISVDILLAAHNEEKMLGRTLESFRSAIEAARGSLPELRARVFVATDACTDETAAIAARHGARVIPGSWRSKWKALEQLVASSGSPWCFFVDAGVVWPRDLLARLIPLTTRADLMGVAPAYHPSGSGRWERAHWAFERYLKGLESRAGGPISIHGATVLYRRNELEVAMKFLGGEAWLNDDVVLPWAMRLLHPGQSLLYWKGEGSEPIVDEGLGKTAAEYARRRRIVLGNLQWARIFLWSLPRSPLLPAVIALRRLFRMLWAWWLLFLAAGLLASWLSPGESLFALGSAALAGAFVIPRGLRDSGLASLLVPCHLLALVRRKETQWG